MRIKARSRIIAIEASVAARQRARWIPAQRTHCGTGRGLEGDGAGDHRQWDYRKMQSFPSLRTLAGKCGSERQTGSPFYKSDRFVPVASVPDGIVFSFTDDSAGNVWVSHQEGLFHLFQERVVERIPWARLGRRQPASALLHDACRVVYGSDFETVASRISGTVGLRASYAGVEGLTRGNGPRFLHRSETVHSGSQLRAG